MLKETAGGKIWPTPCNSFPPISLSLEREKREVIGLDAKALPMTSGFDI